MFGAFIDALLCFLRSALLFGVGGLFLALGLLGGDAVLALWVDNVIKGVDGAAYAVVEVVIVK